MSSITIHWCSLVPEHRGDVRSALGELSETLKERYPDLPQIQLPEMSSSEQKYLPAFLERPRGGFRAPGHQDTPLDDKRVFVFCPRDCRFARNTREVNPQAQWGAAICGDYALVWMPDNKYLIWHEAMHLLNAEDCYDTSGQTVCGESRCIMQYVPCKENCDGELHLCSLNVLNVS